MMTTGAQRRRRLRRQLVGLALGALLLDASLAVAGELYRWVDENGTVHYGDRMPPDSVERDHAVLDKGGTVVREQRSQPAPAARQAESRTPEEPDREARSQRQHDRMLLETFTTEADLLRTRERRLGAIDRQVANVERQIGHLTRQRDQRLARLESKQQPGTEKSTNSASARDQLQEIEARLEKRQHLHEQLQAERGRTAAEFKADLARFRELKKTTRE